LVASGVAGTPRQVGCSLRRSAIFAAFRSRDRFAVEATALTDLIVLALPVAPEHTGGGHGGGIVLLQGRCVLLVISGGIAAYKALDLVRRLRERGAAVRCIMTAAAKHFVTPLSAASLSENKVYDDLWSLTDESEMGHIRLSRETDLVVVAPASADLIARMAAGLADDLATATLLASNKPILLAPAMNAMMWAHPATQANLARLSDRGVLRIGPGSGELACGETGSGRMAEPLEIVAAIERILTGDHRLAGRRALVTSGPTREPIDPVRYLSNHSSGKQGHAIAAALSALGADTVLVSGPTAEPAPPGVLLVPVGTATEMLDACERALPVDVAVFAAAVADWRVEAVARHKLKKNGGAPPLLRLAENPDILAAIARRGDGRPQLVIGFAAETDDIIDNARSKRTRKGCDWILANDVSPDTGTFGGDRNTIHLVDADGLEDWPLMTKREVAVRLAGRIADSLARRPR
jgi:phosphopantothenoylcysteine decarboxylase / phosphopantothenate---cysteine ligase